MAKSKIEAPDKQLSGRTDMNILKRDGKKRQSSAYAPTTKDFLLVILAVALLTTFSWVAYYKLGWFQ